jgi:hypothetical protein
LQEFAVGKEQEPNKVGKLLVFLKGSEESECAPTNNCPFTFISTVPVVQTIDPEWDAATNTWTIKLTGTGFTGSASTTELTTFGGLK